MDRYVQALQKLNNINKYRGMKLTLENITKGCELVGNPQNDLKFIHVAGTNGKGSVSLKLQKIFQAAGYQCGIYTSPHLFTYQERIMINDQYIDKEYVVDTLESLFPLMEKHKVELTFFEYLNIVAFQYYKEKNVDLAVLETGLGGILDSTNVINKNIAAVITSIGFDHMNVLGYTLESIATKKAGIIKQGSPTVIGPNAKPLQIFQNICQEKNSKLYITKGNEDSLIDYNIENNLIVKQTIKAIQDQQIFTDINENHIIQGSQAQQKCRLELLDSQLYDNISKKINKKFKLFFDVGHNSLALDKTFLRLRKQFPTNKIKVVFGTSSAKECLDSLESISKQCETCYLIQSNHYRAMEIDHLIENSEKLKLFNKNWEYQVQPILNNGNINTNLDHLFNNNIQDDDVVIIVGSFFIMRDVREYFGYQDVKDPMELNERVIPMKKPENENIDI